MASKSILKRQLQRLLPLFAGLLLLLVYTAGALPQSASAHAFLVDTQPAPNSKLATAPERITLTFNERLDDGLFYLKVFDQKGKEAVSAKAAMSATHNGIELALPKLAEGIYVISYHVISADGHPVSGSYPLTVGNPPPSAEAPVLTGQPTHAHGASGQQLTLAELLQYMARALWYAAVLLLGGWVIWLRLPGGGGASSRRELAAWTLNLQRAHVVALLFLIFTHTEDLLGGGGFGELVQLFTATSVGISWLALLVLSLVGFVVVGRSAVLDLVWAVLLVAAKCFSGHATSFTPQAATIALDAVHLLAGALWAGGLLLLAVQRKSSPQAAAALLRPFSRMALWSIVVLIVSGAASILLFLPSPRYLLYTLWGKLMLIKIGAVVLVLLTGGLLRLAMYKRREKQLNFWFKLDLTLMAIIIVLVGLITYMAPIPANEPLRWHVMGETQHMSTDITPRAPGTNTFETEVWMPEKSGKPKQVQLILHYEDNASVAPIQVPLEPAAEDADGVQVETYGGFVPFAYQASGEYLSLRGHWTAEVRIMDSEDNEKVYKESFLVY
ncbi:copper resistance protein CopC/CopD [Paenibacillus athensensis]|uniref:Copper resistance protein CopC n=1 Tax=Paenibacillus athensensis TaxID=1967502 RepID=A0A4Y8PXQ9_9BACL|nr:copper resistance protein CopC [Paenibacillus athensensis]MCD1259326.1 copper resistance protein CopC/CopD [Paenibacillus athensensis]